jgi:hypothetical protein
VSEETYRVFKLLPSGEWFPWFPSVTSLEHAMEDLSIVRDEFAGEFRLAKYVTVQEWVDA